MINISSCTNAPFQPPGIAVKALYFTRAAGEKNFNVYAQYNDGKAWVPLHIAFPAHPTLQQVRDIDRNIAINSGSYDNAHLYLRSADGNNMTAAYFTNAEGGGIQVGNKDNYAPLNLQPEGGLLTYHGKEIATKADFTTGIGYLHSNGSSLDFDNSIHVKAGVNYQPNMMSVEQNTILYHHGTESDNPSGGNTGYSINGAVDSISSMQMFIATGAATGFNPDGFYWRGNNAGGPGWPGPWRQVASREWVTANFLSTANVINVQYTSAQNANFWISGSARAQHFVANSLGYSITAGSGYFGFFTDTGLSTALPIKAKELVLSDSYADVAPANGLFVKGAVVLKSLSGNGNEILVTDNNGNISTQPLPSGTLPLGNVLLSADNPVIDLSVNTVANNRLGSISVFNNSGSTLNNVSVTVEYTQPYAVIAKATISAANASAGQAMVSGSYVFLRDNNATLFVIFIKTIPPGETLAFDYNVQGY